MKIKFLTIVAVFFTLVCQSQSWTDILLSSENYFEILEKADSYFEQNGKGRGSGYKHFVRWQKEAQYQIFADGTFPTNSFANKVQAYKTVNRDNSKRSYHGQWENIGPFDYQTSDPSHMGGIGRVSCIAFHPTNTNILWIGTPAGGLWKTTNAGVNWTPLTDGLPRIGIAGIAINSNNINHITILTGDNASSNTPSLGVLNSFDGGQTWQFSDLQIESLPTVYPHLLKQHPTNPLILFAAFRYDVTHDYGGLHKSTDGGITWTQVISGQTVWDIEFKPGQPNNMYAAVQDGVTGTLKTSPNTGTNWFLNGDSDYPVEASRMSIAISPSQPNSIYAVFGGGTTTNGTFQGLYKSNDNGNDFVMKSNTPNILGWSMDGGDGDDQAWRDLALIVDPMNDNRIFVGGVCIWGSENGGTSWDRKSWWLRDDPAQPYVHADFQNFYFQGSKMWIINDGGIYTSTDLAASFVEHSAGLSNMQFYHIDVYNGSYMGGSQDNGTNGGPVTSTQASYLTGGDGFGCTWHSGNDQIQFTSANKTVYRYQFGSPLPILTGLSNTVDDVRMHVTDPNYIFVNEGLNLWRGNENFLSDWTWVNLGTSYVPGSTAVSDFSQCLTNPQVMYVSMTKKLIKSLNIGSSSPSWTTLANPDDSLVYYDIIVDPDNQSKIWTICGGYKDGKKVYFSDSGGSSWINITYNLPNIPIRCIQYEDGSNDGIYIGTEIGVFYKNATMTEWLYFGNYLPNVPVNDIEIDDGYVYAGTYGRGVWRSQVYSDCLANLFLTNGNDPTLNQTGTQVYSASNSILSLRTYLGNPGTNVLYQAGSYTDLSLGFEVKAGAFFEAKVGPCQE